MLANLQAEMIRFGISNTDLQSALSCSPATITNKLRGTSAFSIWDAVKIRDTFFPQMKLEYLFARDEERSSA